jgi:hypothetical protein
MLPQLVADLSQVKHDLDILMSLTDPILGTPLIDAARSKNYTTAVDALETTLTDIITPPWIPKNLPKLNGCIAALSANATDLERMVSEASDVLKRGLPDEMVGYKVVEISARVLRFQLDVLFEAVAKLMAATEQITVRAGKPKEAN